MSAAGARDRALDELARLHGVLPAHRANDGSVQSVPAETLHPVLRALGVDAAEPRSALRERRRSLWREVVPPVAVSWLPGPVRLELRLPAGSAGPIAVRVECEDGRLAAHELRAPPDAPPAAVRRVEGQSFVRTSLPMPFALPQGYHRGAVEFAGERWPFLWIAAPRTAQPVDGRQLGLFVPLYALHSQRRPGCGDLTDWLRLCERAGDLGVGLMGTLPLCAAFLDEPVEPSPYGPVSRLFWNEVYVDCERLPEFASSEAARAALAGEQDPPADPRHVEWPAVAARRRQALAACADRHFAAGEAARDPALLAFLRARPDAAAFARFRAAQERHGRNWRAWPAALRDGQAPADFDPRAFHRQLYAQWRAQEQIDHVLERMRAHGTGLYLDLPLGVHPDGYDAFCYRAELLEGCSAGAPPDPFFTRGQDWGFRPLHPRASRTEGHRYFRACLRHQLAHCGALRVDHVMGLYRTWCVPHGLSADRGCYVRQPAEELFAILTLESRRRQCAVIGEDLGTVPVAIERALAEHGVLSMHIVQFALREDDAGPALRPGAGCLAALNTHDMPTFAAFLDAADVEDRQALGLLDADGADAERRRRARLVAALRRALALAPGGHEEAAQTVQRCLEALARSEAAIVVLALEDLWGETSPQNVPGTGTERRNWQRRTRLSLEEVLQSPELGRRIAALASARSP